MALLCQQNETETQFRQHLISLRVPAAVGFTLQKLRGVLFRISNCDGIVLVIIAYPACHYILAEYKTIDFYIVLFRGSFTCSFISIFTCADIGTYSTVNLASARLSLQRTYQVKHFGPKGLRQIPVIARHFPLRWRKHFRWSVKTLSHSNPVFSKVLFYNIISVCTYPCIA
jgi:hypothetical protein